MLFNAPEFILAFLPVTLAGFFLLGAFGRRTAAIWWLAGASLFFYGWWKISFVPLIVGSVLFNFAVGTALIRRPNRRLLALGIAANLGALGWFKYAGFLAEAANLLSGLGLPVPQIILPLAISFYTFQQVAFLVDAHDGMVEETDFGRYCVFILFFPQLIAGPIVHHKEVLTQFDDPAIYRPQLGSFAIGLTVFAIGLFKKVYLADPLSETAALAYAPAALGVAPPFVDGWVGVTAFSLQLYFDFSGYSDMAIGLALMFGIRLPINFASPFKAASIIEFWSRWHITLTRFLTAYLYNPILMTLTKRRMAAGKPLLKRSAPAFVPFVMLLATPTLITMVLAGVWHGAGWQFLVFGAFHGVMLVANHAWRHFAPKRTLPGWIAWSTRPLCVAITFALVTVSFIFFKSTSLGQALLVVQGIAGLGGVEPAIAQPPPMPVVASGPAPNLWDVILRKAWNRLMTEDVWRVLSGLAIVCLLPNTQQWLAGCTAFAGRADRPMGLVPRLAWRPTMAQGAAVGVLFCLTLLQAFSAAPTEFLYFTF